MGARSQLCSAKRVNAHERDVSYITRLQGCGKSTRYKLLPSPMVVGLQAPLSDPIKYQRNPRLSRQPRGCMRTQQEPQFSGELATRWDRPHNLAIGQSRPSPSVREFPASVADRFTAGLTVVFTTFRRPLIRHPARRDHSGGFSSRYSFHVRAWYCFSKSAYHSGIGAARESVGFTPVRGCGIRLESARHGVPQTTVSGAMVVGVAREAAVGES